MSNTLIFNLVATCSSSCMLDPCMEWSLIFLFLLIPNLFFISRCRHLAPSSWLIFLKILFISFHREGKGEIKRGRETSMCGCLSQAPNWGPGQQPKHVFRLGIKPVTFQLVGLCSIHWATLVRAFCCCCCCLIRVVPVIPPLLSSTFLRIKILECQIATEGIWSKGTHFQFWSQSV